MLQLTNLNLKHAAYFCCGCYLSAMVAIMVIDKPLALLMHHSGWDQWLYLRLITEKLLWPLTLLLIVAVMWQNFTLLKLIRNTGMGQADTRVPDPTTSLLGATEHFRMMNTDEYSNKLRGLVAGAYFYLCLQLTLELKTGLKIIFGRYWPTTWIAGNLSLIHDGIYGFHWWHGWGNQGGFPSGHTTYTLFCCTCLYLTLPRLKYLWLLLALLIPSCLIILNYHFLGDCLAGIGLGSFSALLSARLWQKLARIRG